MTLTKFKRSIAAFILLFFFANTSIFAGEPAMSLYDIEVTTIDHNMTTLAPYRGKVLLIVNVASHCGFTPQYEQLQALYQTYREKGLVVLGFPCNQFGAQESGSEEEIVRFCSTNFDVTFPMFEKIDVNGANAHPLYRYLKSAQSGLLGSESIKWNFTKFLVDRQGNVVARYAPMTTPLSIEADIKRLLAAEAPSNPPAH